MLLYKYRPWNKFTKEVLLKNEIFFPTKALLNDPAELIHPIIFDHNIWSDSILKIENNLMVETDEIKIEKIAIAIREKDIIELEKQGLNNKEIHSIFSHKNKHLQLQEAIYHTFPLKEGLQNAIIAGSKYKAFLSVNEDEIVQFLNQKLENVGILSLSGKCDCPVMWAHYAENHSGVVLIFDSQNDELLQSARIVKYQKTRPKITVENIIDVMFKKAKNWEYEYEYRVITKQGNIPLSFNESALSGIILGIHQPPKVQEEIQELVNKKRHSVKVYKARTSKNTFSINYEEL